MTDRPILFSAPMVRALLAGTKTQTRRVLNLQPGTGAAGCYHRPDEQWIWINHRRPNNGAGEGVGISDPFPIRYAVGDRLYVREAWKTTSQYDATAPRDLPKTAPIFFTADDRLWPVARYRQGMHQPRWASRLTLPVNDVRVQRLQDISEADAIAEGIHCHTYGELAAAGLQSIANGPTDADRKLFTAFDVRAEADCLWATAKDAYRELWNHLNEARGFGWDTNPWVVAVTFTVEHRNIDAVPA